MGITYRFVGKVRGYIYGLDLSSDFLIELKKEADKRSKQIRKSSYRKTKSQRRRMR